MNFGDSTPSELLSASSKAIDQQVILSHLISTGILVACLLVVRALLARMMRRQENLRQDVRRRWLVTLRNGTMFLTLVGVVLIWSQELQTVAVYAIAIAVATVLATKELIQCATGSLMRAAGGIFHLGDRIEVGDWRGDVIDQNLLTTTIMEVGPDGLTHRLTGRAVSLPNSIFLAKPVVNETYTDDYVLHVFRVPMKQEDDWQQGEQDLLCAAREQCGDYIEGARLHFEKLSRKEGLAVFAVEPRVTIQVPSADNVELIVRLAVPARQKGKVEQAILREFLELRKQRSADATDCAGSRNDATGAGD